MSELEWYANEHCSKDGAVSLAAVDGVFESDTVVAHTTLSAPCPLLHVMRTGR